jgi:hypothetical protein
MDIRKLVEKIRNLHTKQLVALAVVALVAVSTVIRLIAGDSRKSMTPTVLRPVEDEIAESGEKKKLIDESIKEVKKEERKILSEKGRYFGEVQGRGKKPEAKQPGLKVPSLQGHSSEYLVRQLREAAAMQAVEDPKRSAMAKVFQVFYSGKVSQGSLIAKGNGNEKQEEADRKLLAIPGLQYWRFYRGVVRETVSNARFSKIPIEIEITEAPLKGCLVLAEGQTVRTMDRITADIRGLVYDGNSYEIKGTVFSIDYTRGVASRAIRHEIMQAEADFLMKGAFTALETARSDETQTTVGGLGNTYMTEMKADDRTREAILQGGSEALKELKTHTDRHFDRYPPVEVIVDRGTPVYVRFENHGRRYP